MNEPLAPVSYETLWKTAWGDLQRVGPVHRHNMEHLLRVVFPLDVRTILDLGCGAGENLAALAAAQRYELTGADIAEEALTLARQRVPAARFVRLDMQQDALSEQFDLVLSLQVIEHLADDVRALKNAIRMARKYVFVSTIQGPIYPSDRTIGHLRSYTPQELRRKLTEAGLEVVQVWQWGFPFYSPLFRTVTEWLPGGAPTGQIGPIGRVAARLLYHLYRLNWPGRGDVISALARPVR